MKNEVLKKVNGITRNREWELENKTLFYRNPNWIDKNQIDLFLRYIHIYTHVILVSLIILSNPVSQGSP